MLKFKTHYNGETMAINGGFWAVILIDEYTSDAR